MPDGDVDTPKDRSARAIEALRSFILEIAPGSRALSSAEISRYAPRRVVAGWRFTVEFADARRVIDALVDADLPYSPPRIAVVDGPPVLSWPHYEDDGVLCIYDEMVAVDALDPVRVLKETLCAAGGLIEDANAGRLDDDFRAEFTSYWNRHCDAGALAFRSIIEPHPPSRLVKVWLGKYFALLAEDTASGRSWLKNAFPTIDVEGYTFHPAVLMCLTKPPLPRDFPRFVQQARPSRRAVCG